MAWTWRWSYLVRRAAQVSVPFPDWDAHRRLSVEDAN